MTAFYLLFFPIELIALLATTNDDLSCLSHRSLVYSVVPLIILVVFLFAFSISSMSLRDHTVLKV